MSFLGRISAALDGDNRKKSDNHEKGRKLYYADADAGIKMMEENSRTKRDYEKTAAKQWEKVKDKKGRAAAFDDPDYKRLMGLAAKAEY